MLGKNSVLSYYYYIDMRVMLHMKTFSGERFGGRVVRQFQISHLGVECHMPGFF